MFSLAVSFYFDSGGSACANINILSYLKLSQRNHTLADATLPVGKIHHFSKIAKTFETLMQF